MTIIKIYRILILLLFSSIISINTFGQAINSDSLLYQALHEAKVKNYSLSKEQARLGIKIAPEYLDFHLLLGRLHQLTGQPDSARIYLNHVIDNDPNYVEAFGYITDLEINQGNLDLALRYINEGIENHPDHQAFYFKKMSIFQIEERYKDEKVFIEGSLGRFPNNSEFRQRLYFLETRNKTDRLGVNYSLTGFDRERVGPWHLIGLQYIRERNWGSLIGRVNYADRQSLGESISSGTQFELESYVFIGKNGYTHLSGAYSDSEVFPRTRLGLSYFHNYRDGWESEIGGRLVNVAGRQFRSGILGIGKYMGSFWLNGRMFLQNEEPNYYPAFTFTSRYYFNSRFDYLQVLTGYGTSPDERATLNQFENRVAMDSYRVGLGYFRLWNDHILTGTQFTFNHQQIIPGLQQKEYELFLMLQYKF